MTPARLLPPEFKEKLIEIAKKGMRQVQMNRDGRWMWVSKDVVDRNDPMIPKERSPPAS